MRAPFAVSQDSGFFATIRTFLGEFIAFAGRKGLWAAFAVALGAVLEGFGFVLMIPLLGAVIGSGSASGLLRRTISALFHQFGIVTALGRLSLLMAIFAALMILRAFIVSYRDVTLVELQIGFVEKQRAGIAERLAAASWSQVVGLRHARITHLMSGDIQRIGVAAHAMLQCAVAVVVLLAYCITAFVMSPGLASISFVLLIVGAITFVPFLRRAHDLGAFSTRANLALLDATARFLGGLKLAVSQNLQMNFVGEFRQTLNELTARQMAQTREQTRRRILQTTLPSLVAALLVLVGFGLYHVVPPVLFAFLLIVLRMNGPAGQIQQGAQQLATALPAYEKVKELERELDSIPYDAPSRADGAAIPDGPIVFENVSFLHPLEDGDGEPARGVRELNISIQPGEFVGVVGPSGAGKTTFADLLVHLHEPQEGRISIGGIALDRAAIAAWRERVSYVSQDPFLFHDSVRRNLAWANSNALENEMWDALAQAGADDLVRAMSEGLDTVVGERGTLVSGGERQKIALARALLRRPSVLILDEATNAIDVQGEKRFLERLCALAPRPIIVMIAHRAESLALCSRLLRFEDGRVAPYVA